MEFTRADWRRLAELRERFLAAEVRDTNSPLPPYWADERDFEIYDATFAQRIGWKFRAVMRELQLRGRLPSGALVVDWGCGTGIAAREYCAVAGAQAGQRFVLFDRSREATDFARMKLLEVHPELEVSTDRLSPTIEPDVLLISHVLDELGDEDRHQLLNLVRRSRAVVWVEAGSRATSRKLCQLRDELLAHFDVVAPCTHSVKCGVLAAGQSANWCHHFARAPAEAFTSAHWRTFADTLGIDLRSLPYSFIALERRSENSPKTAANARFLGRPRMMKGRAMLDVCDESGVREMSLLQRTDRALFRRLDDAAGELLLFSITADGRRITAIEPRAQ